MKKMQATGWNLNYVDRRIGIGSEICKVLDPGPVHYARTCSLLHRKSILLPSLLRALCSELWYESSRGPSITSRLISIALNNQLISHQISIEEISHCLHCCNTCQLIGFADNFYKRTICGEEKQSTINNRRCKLAKLV